MRRTGYYKTCRYCGQRILASDNYCYHCGKAQNGDVKVYYPSLISHVAHWLHKVA